MPSKIDSAAEEAQQEISKSVQQIQDNLSSRLAPQQPSAASQSPSGAATATDDDRYSSPLFRDEVQQQEMRYLDQFFFGKRGGDISCGLSGGNSTSINGGSFSQMNNVNVAGAEESQSKIAAILRPHCYEDNHDAMVTYNPWEDGIRAHTGEGFVDARGETTTTTTCNNSTIQTRSYTDGKTQLLHVDNDRNDSFKQSVNPIPRQSTQSQRILNRSQAKTPIPSTNKRRRLMQRAQNTRRRLVTNLVKLGRQCTLNMFNLSNVVHGSVRRAIVNTHSFLEETAPKERMNGTRKKHRVARRGRVERSHGNRSASTTAVHAPPLRAFSFCTAWLGTSSNELTEKAVAFVQKSVRNGKNTAN